ncbi:DUF397 domain-containing protein [Streptomyces sp. MNP-20]|uniref:DUF397 domain-containing protein n=1 Tax=Streptomyces sp. MNP-20 TaxID=2721165 RepID=UPI002814C653|nr:DUF397 domain-containing protein [Streptomyces sp. MNP-20]
MEVVIDTKIMAPDVAPESAWFKSSYSNDTGGSCVEVAALPHCRRVGVRDSKIKSGPAFVVSSSTWNSFVDHVGRDTNWGVARSDT